MSRDVFICHSSQDKEVADAICESLEAHKISCWIAPRDVRPGKNWGSAIVEAIAESKVLVLILSKHSNSSPQVVREIERAVHKELTIIPFRVDDILPSEDLEYFVSSCHWLDAMEPPLQPHLDALRDAILGTESTESSRQGSTASKKSRGHSRLKLWGALAALALTMAAAGAWFFAHKSAGKTVTLERPGAGASLVGPLLLSWSNAGLDQENLSFEVAITAPGKPTAITRTARNSIVPQGVEGAVRWKVQPIWQLAGGKETRGAWSPERAFTYYASSLNRIIATHRVHIGTAEPDGVFIRQDGPEITGIEIELLREMVAKVLQKHGVNVRPAITYTRRIWGDEFFRLLETDGGIDLLASGISITPEREKKYGLVFTAPTLRYPQSLITKRGVNGFANGKLQVDNIGAVANTTNESVARKLLGETAATAFKSYEGTGAYDRILANLVAGRIDAALIDKPYALQKIAELKQSIGADLVAVDVTNAMLPGIETEKVGFALRKSDHALLAEINEQLAGDDTARRALLAKLIPGWED